MAEGSADQELLLTIADNSFSGVIYYKAVRNTEGIIIDFIYDFINDNAMKILKGVKSDYIGTTLLSHFPDTKDSLVFRSYVKALETGENQDIVFNYTGEGYASWYRNKIVRYGADGVIVFFLDETGVSQITQELYKERKRVQDLTEKENQFFSVILDQALDGILYIFPIFSDNGEIQDFRFQFINHSAAVYLKTTEDELYSKTFLTAFPNAVDNGTFGMYQNVYQKNILDKTIAYYSDDKIHGWYEVVAFKYQEGVIIYFRDITEFVENEKQIKERNAALQKLVREKEILLQETHHRVKNNMQVISSLLNLQKNLIRDNDAIDALEISIHRIRTIALIHENLYRQNDFEYINFKHFLEQIVANTKEFHSEINDNINYTIESENLELELERCINIGLIINEVLTNSVKHAFNGQKQGEIFIKCRKEDGMLMIDLRDNGSGLPDDYLNGGRKTLGLTLIESLVEQLNGKLKITVNGGTNFQLLIPNN